jgi:hypothetical protein
LSVVVVVVDQETVVPVAVELTEEQEVVPADLSKPVMFQ